MQKFIKSTYQLNSVIYDILGEFSADYDAIDEGTYMEDLAKYINYYCCEKYTEEEAADIIEETYLDPMTYLQHTFPELFTCCDITPRKWLQIILMMRLTETYNLDIVFATHEIY